MRLTVAVGLLLAAMAVSIVTRSAAAYYLTSSGFIYGLLSRRFRIWPW